MTLSYFKGKSVEDTFCMNCNSNSILSLMALESLQFRIHAEDSFSYKY